MSKHPEIKEPIGGWKKREDTLEDWTEVILGRGRKRRAATAIEKKNEDETERNKEGTRVQLQEY